MMTMHRLVPLMCDRMLNGSTSSCRGTDAANWREIKLRHYCLAGQLLLDGLDVLQINLLHVN
jgi:hypothetical protein